MKFSWNLGNEPVNKRLIFLVAIRIMDPDTDPYPDRDTGKTALAEVCTVPVLLVIIITARMPRVCLFVVVAVVSLFLALSEACNLLKYRTESCHRRARC